MHRLRNTALAGLVALFVTAVPVSTAQSVEEALSRLRERYDAMGSMRATFTQVTTSTFLDEPERYAGSVLLSGDRYRIETAQQTIVTDTVRTWVYNRYENQVLINDYESDPSTFSLSSFLDEFDTAYRVQEYRLDDGLDRITLSPEDPLSAFRTVTIWTDDGVVRRLHVVDLNDIEMNIALSDIVFNPELPADSFTFSIPEGAELIDLREN